jgi:L-arabinonolactonase
MGNTVQEDATMTIELAVDCRNQLGEGPVWDVQEQALYWVDIAGRMLQRRQHATGTVQHWTMPERIASFALRRSSGMVLALETGFAFFEPLTEKLRWISRPEVMIRHNRFNDGKCDSSGRFWAGTMDDRAAEHTGSLYRLDSDLAVHRMGDGIGISNSLAWSPDDSTFYFADTLDGRIYAYDFDAPSGAISRKRPFVSVSGPGVPDGSAVDSEGYLWNAEWNGWRIVRYAPDGSVDRVIALPVQKPTSCAFGGPDLRTLYVTSAAWDLGQSDLAAQPWAGGVLAIEVDVAGLPAPRFAG